MAVSWKSVNFASETIILLNMCTKKTLYKAGNATDIALKPRKRGEEMTFSQISFATDCLRMLANRKDMPIVELVQEMSVRDLFRQFYDLMKANPAYSKVQVVNRLQKIIGA